MNIEEITIKEAREIAALFGGKSTQPCPWNVGKNYFIRTVTHHLTGTLVQVTEQELVLVDAAWIAEDGRFADAVATCNFSEVEPFPQGKRVIVGRGSLIDAVEIDTLQRRQK